MLQRSTHAEGLPTDLVTVARSQGGAVSAPQAHEHLGERALQVATQAGDLVRLWRGWYAVPRRSSDGTAKVPLSTRLAAADLTLGTRAVACGPTAAALFGFDLTGDGRTHVATQRSWGSARSQLVLHRVPTTSVDWLRGRPAVCAAETALRLASHAPDSPRALAQLDAALRSGRISPGELAATADALHIRRIGAVRPIVPLADGRAESPGESWLRWVCLDAGLPPPVPQLRVVGADGRTYRLDLGWPDRRAGAEFDGVEFHTGAALTRDRAKLNALSGVGWSLVFVTSRMIWGGRDQVVEQLREALA